MGKITHTDLSGVTQGQWGANSTHVFEGTTTPWQMPIVCTTEAELIAAVAAVSDFETIKTMGAIALTGTLTLADKDGVTYDTRDSAITYGGTSYAIAWQPVATDEYLRYGRLLLGSLTATGSALTSATAVGVYINNIQESEFSGHIFQFRAGASVQIGSAAANWSGLLTISKLEILQCRKGLEFVGDGAVHSISIGEFWWAPADDTAPNYGIIDSKGTGNANTIKMGVVYLEPSAVANSTGIYSDGGVGWSIDQLSWDTSAVANVSVYSATPIQIGVAYGSNTEQTFAACQIPAASMRQALERTYGGRIMPFTIAADSWVASNAESGSCSFTAMRMSTATGVTANSRGLAYIYLSGMHLDESVDILHWDKPLYLTFRYARRMSEAESIARVQIKEAATEGQLAAQGLGLQLDNLNVTFESYGASRGTAITTPVTQLTAADAYDITIIHLPGYADHLYLGNGSNNSPRSVTITTAANIPSGASGVVYVVVSIINGVSGGTDTSQYIMFPVLWQGD